MGAILWVTFIVLPDPPGFVQAFQAHTSPAEISDDLDGHDLGSGDPVKGSEHEGVAIAQVVLAGMPLRSITHTAGLAVIDEHALSTSSSQLGFLSPRRLLTGAYSGVAHDGAHISTPGTPDLPRLMLGPFLG